MDSFPDKLEENKLYISEKYKTTAHNCFCGCGMETYMSINPENKLHWDLIKNADETISIIGSVGNWGFDCRSHYNIVSNKVQFL